uniref:Uncharacterized protein n=1 Tax=Trichuris muris TaxID=70415 RepID=A0A5S6QQB7_TRIMR
MYAWSHGYTTIRFCCDQLEMSKNTALHWNLSMTDVAAEVLMRQHLVIRGTGLTVEIIVVFITSYLDELLKFKLGFSGNVL